MSSSITSTTLRAMADALDSLAKISARVDTLDVAGVRLVVRRHDDQRDGAWYELVGIGGTWTRGGNTDGT